MPGRKSSDDKGLQFNAIFEGMDASYRDAVVSQALSSRGQVASDATNALNTAIQKSRVRVTGYRDAIRAPHTMLRAPIAQLVAVNGEIAGAVLRVWGESQPALRERVVEFLRSAGVEAENADHSAKQFQGTWTTMEWNAQKAEFLQRYSDDVFGEHDAGLMLCYVAGRVPGTRGRSAAGVVAESSKRRFDEFLDFFKRLPAGAPEWEEAVPEFLDAFSELIAAKEAELKWVDEFDAALLSIKREFEEILTFFECDTEEWSAQRVSRTVDPPTAMRLVEELGDGLAEYRPIHDRAQSISEERERAGRREELQPRILDLSQRMDELMEESAQDESGGRAGNGVPVQREGDGPHEHSELIAAGQEPTPTNPLQEALTAAESHHGGHAVPPQAHPDAAAEIERLKTEVGSLLENVNSLNAQMQALKDHNEALETELQDSQRREDSWRIAFRSAKDDSPEVESEEALEIESVNDAVELAKSRFRQELVFAPNSESSVEENPFTHPQRVWEAFRWLATTYYASKMGRLRVTDFDQSIKEACGWWYKGDQGETTLSRYEKSYTTRVDGRRHWLAEHIGKGTSFDARYTIRIAFVWDRDRRQVVIGYIGRHQQTDAS